MTKNEAKQKLKELFTEYPDILKAFKQDDWKEVDKILHEISASRLEVSNFYNSLYTLDLELLEEILIDLGFVPETMFWGCTDLTSFEIPAGVTSIARAAFSNCESLTNIMIPNSVRSIGDDAFFDCISLKNIIIPNNVTYLGSAAFWNCASLTDITIPHSVTTIGDYAFAQCENLNLTLPIRFKNYKNYIYNYIDCISVEFY